MNGEQVTITWSEPHRYRRSLERPGKYFSGLRKTLLRFGGVFALMFIGGYLFEAFDQETSIPLYVKLLLSTGFATFFALVLGGISAVSDGRVTIDKQGILRGCNSWMGFKIEHWPWASIAAVSFEEGAAGKERFLVLVLSCRDGRSHRIGLHSTTVLKDVVQCLDHYRLHEAEAVFTILAPHDVLERLERYRDDPNRNKHRYEKTRYAR